MKTKLLHIGLFLFLSLFLSLSASYSTDKNLSHIVKKGDTLWSICEQYYGNPFLWPELWEMNKFITNPHWLKPGDILELMQHEEVLKKAQKPIKKKSEPLEKLIGINASGLTNMKALGFLRSKKTDTWGRIFDLKVKRKLIGQGDIVYVKMDKGDIKPGDKFTVLNLSDPVKHPLTGKECGYVHSFKGILEIVKILKDYQIARISESFREIYKGDFLIPYRPISSCILPVPYEGNIEARIMAAKDGLQLIGQHSVVYIDAGHQEDVRRGYIFNAIEERESVSKDKKEAKVILPPVILGKILILKTKRHTSTGVVFWANKEFNSGVKVRPQTWHDKPWEFGTLPVCPIE